MKQRIIILLFGLGFFLGLFIFFGMTIKTVKAESTFQISPCETMLADAANRAGVSADNVEWQGTENWGNDGPILLDELWSCSGKYLWGADEYVEFYVNPVTTFDAPDWSNYCTGLDDQSCEADIFHGNSAKLSLWKPVDWDNPDANEDVALEYRWSQQSDGQRYEFFVYYDPVDRNAERSEVMAIAEALWAAANEAADAIESDTSILPPGDEGADQNPNEQNPEDQPGSDVPTILGDPIGSDQPKSLGPLATTPLVPLAGALIGTVIGWLVSVAATSGNVLKTLATPPLRPTQPPATAAGPKDAGSPVAKTPIPPSDVQRPAKPADAPKSGAEHLWDIVTNLAGSSSTVIGSLSEFFDFQEDAKTLQKIGDSLQAWKNNPTKEAADAYAKNLRGVTNQNAVLAKAGKALGNAANVLDGADAVIKGMKKASERGYVGSDYVLAVGAEVSKKALNYALTKNPVVGLVNSALGGITEMAYGKDGRIDIGSIVDKGADTWDSTTQEYAGYTGGDWFAPENKDFGEVLANDAELRRKDQYLHGVRQIKKLVDQGKISLQEGGARIRGLRDAMLGGE